VESFNVSACIAKGVLIMKPISKLSELIKNIQTLDEYLNSRVDPEYSFARSLVKRGICFVAVKDSEIYQFYPSRFIGYINNSMDAHSNNPYKNGRITNPAISEILGAEPSVNSFLNREYAKHCESLGFEARERGSFGIERKFWVLRLD
jgi:hypothetical protein